MLTYSFEDIGNDTLYEHLYKAVKNDILNGTLTPMQKLPSKRSFAKNLSISTITVENAYSQLLAEGYIFSVPKKGYYVSDFSNPLLPDINIKSDFHNTDMKQNHPNTDTGQNTSNTDTTQNIFNTDVRQNVLNTDIRQNIFNIDTMSTSVNTHNMPEAFTSINLTVNHINADNFPFSIWSKLIREVISTEKSSLMKPLPSAGSYELRSAIAKHLRDYRGLKVSPEQIIIGAGTEYLYSIIIQLMGRKLVYGLEDPGYKKISKIYNSHKVACTYIPITASGINMDILRKSSADIMHISPSHHFPTGIVTSIRTRYKLLEWANENKTRYIIEDDYDTEFRLVGKPIPALLGIDRNEKVIYMNSFSKSLSSTIRISYMVLPAQLMKKYNETLSFYSCTVSSFEQATLAKFISDGYFEKHINRMRNYYRKLRDTLLNAIRKSPLNSNCTILEENSGLHFLLKINTDKTDTQLKADARSNGLIISCMSDYYMHHPINNNEHIIIINYSGIDAGSINSIIEKLCRII